MLARAGLGLWPTGLRALEAHWADDLSPSAQQQWDATQARWLMACERTREAQFYQQCYAAARAASIRTEGVACVVDPDVV